MWDSATSCQFITYLKFYFLSILLLHEILTMDKAGTYTVTDDVSSMKLQTLIFIVGDGQVLLGYKKRGFGEGKWNGYGGKRDGSESLKDCVKRELYEESNLELEEDDLVHLGFVQFKENEIIDRRVHVYTCARASVKGDLQDTEEMKAKWFDVSELPYDDMWDDAYFWMPFVFKQIPFEATFTLSEEQKIQGINIDLKDK